MQRRYLLIAGAVSLVVFVVRASPSLSVRATDYAQSVRLTAPVKPSEDGTKNVYPVAAQSAAVAAISKRIGGKSPLLVQGEPADGTIERFTIGGAVGYDVEVALVKHGIELTPELRAAVQAALQQVSGEAVNVQRVVLATGTITVETDAGPRVVNVTSAPP